MLKKRFQQVIDVTFHKIRQLTDTKGEEYSGAEDNQLANFQRGAATVGLIQEKVLWVYLSKHMDSIASWIRNGGVSVDQKLSEPITGRIDDAILYLLLMKAMVVDHNDVNHWAVGAGDLPVAARRKAAIGALIDNVNPDDLIPASQPRPAPLVLSLQQRISCLVATLPSSGEEFYFALKNTADLWEGNSIRALARFVEYKTATGLDQIRISQEDRDPDCDLLAAPLASDTKLERKAVMQALAILAKTPSADLRVGLEMSKGSWDDPQSLRELQEFAQRTLLTRGDKQAAALPNPSERVYTHVPRFMPKPMSLLDPFNSVEHLADYLRQKGWRPDADAQFTGVTELFERIIGHKGNEVAQRIGIELSELLISNDPLKQPVYDDAWDSLMRRVLNWQHWTCDCFVVAVIKDSASGITDVLLTRAIVPPTATRLPMTPPKDVQ